MIEKLILALCLCVPAFGQGILTPIMAGGASVTASPVTFVKTPATGANCSTSAVACAAPAFGTNTVAGHGMVVCATWGVRTGGGTGFSLTSVTDGEGNSYTVESGTRQVFDATTNYSEIGAECAHTTGGLVGGTTDIVTCNYSAGMTGFHESACFPVEVTAFSAVGPVNAGQGTSATLNAGSVTTLVNGSFAFVGGVQDDGGGVGTLIITPGSGFTVGNQTGASNEDSGSEYQAQTSAGVINGTATTGGSHPFAAGIITVHP